MYLPIIEKNMTNILTHPSVFFVYMVFFPALPYTPHKATSHFVDICFKFAQTTVFLLHFSLYYS